jgi:hypothetical protein
MGLSLKSRYGSLAVIAGASEGIGAAFASALAQEGMDLMLVARRELPLLNIKEELESKFSVKVEILAADLGDSNFPAQLLQKLAGRKVNMLIYNAALAYIGALEEKPLEEHLQITRVNVQMPLQLTYLLGNQMLEEGRGAILLMSSMAGSQGSGFLSTYAATKAFNTVFAESMWYEWKNRGVDVIACCAGSTNTPGYVNSKPANAGPFAPAVQTPEQVVEESLSKIGRQPSFISGTQNKLASFFMNRVLPKKMAVSIMGDTTRKIFSIKQ